MPSVWAAFSASRFMQNNLNSAAMAVSSAASIADLRCLAERRLPRVVFDYIDGGADGEVTLRENCRAFDDVTLRPRFAVANASGDLSTTVLGTPIDLPFFLAPIGSCRMFHPRAEVLAARASRHTAAGPAVPAPQRSDRRPPAPGLVSATSSAVGMSRSPPWTAPGRPATPPSW
jgi:hypothetical protein